VIALLVAALVAAIALGAGTATATERRGGAWSPEVGSWSPEVNYALNCQGCHRATGVATKDLVPPLAPEIGRLVRVPEGRAYLIRLPNVASTALSDEETAVLLTWVVQRFGGEELPRDFAPFTAQEVASRRGDPLVDVEAERRAVLDALARDASLGSVGSP
jgi:hypothetical protein